MEIRSEELIDGHQTVPYQLGALFWGVNCMVVIPTHFNPNNSLLILLQISLPLIFTPALNHFVSLTTNIHSLVGIFGVPSIIYVKK